MCQSIQIVHKWCPLLCNTVEKRLYINCHTKDKKGEFIKDTILSFLGEKSRDHPCYPQKWDIYFPIFSSEKLSLIPNIFFVKLLCTAYILYERHNFLDDTTCQLEFIASKCQVSGLVYCLKFFIFHKKVLRTFNGICTSDFQVLIKG